MLQSPRSPRLQHTAGYYDPTIEKTNYYADTTERRNHNEVMAIVAQKEKDDLVSSSLNVQSALRGASDTLIKKQKLLSDAQRDIATLAVERTKLVEQLSNNRQMVEEEIQQQRALQAELDGSIRKLELQAVDTRAHHQKQHNKVDLHVRRNADLNGQIKTLIAAVEHVASEHTATVAANNVQKDRVTTAINDTEGQVAVIIEQCQRVEKQMFDSDGEHSKHCERLRKRGAEAKSDMTERAALVDAANGRLATMELESDDAARRRRKDGEEQKRQELADRKQLLQQLESDRDEAGRRHRADTNKQAEVLRTEVDAATKDLTACRDGLTQAFHKELALHDEIRKGSNDLVGVDSLQERSTVADDAARAWKERADAVTAEARHRMSLLHERTQYARSLEAQVAPLPDVEAAIASHQVKANSYHKAKADFEAERAIQAVRVNERQDADCQKMSLIENSMKAAHTDVQRSRDDIADRTAALESDTRVVENDVAAVNSKLEDLNERNRQLDATLEHISRQRRLMAEELMHRRDAARSAATALLAQLE